MLQKLESRKSVERFERIERRRASGELDRPQRVEGKEGPEWVYGETKAVTPEGIFDSETFRQQLAADAEGWVQSIIDDFGTTQAQQFNTSFDLHNEAVTQAILDQVNRLKGVETTTYDAIKRTLAEGEAAGEPMNKLAARVAAVFDTATGYRAEMIARTEVLSAANAGKLLAAQQSGVAQTKVWIGIEDNRICPICEGLDGQSVGINAQFADGNVAPPDHPACRCTMLFGATSPASTTGTGKVFEALLSQKGRWAGRTKPFVPPPVPVAPHVVAGKARHEVKKGHWATIHGDHVFLDGGGAGGSGGGGGALGGGAFSGLDKPGFVSSAEMDRLQRLADEKVKNAPTPSEADVARNRDQISRSGRAGGELRGNSRDRASRTHTLLREFGDGEHCGCVYCGRQLDASTLTQDKIFTAEQGGRYRIANLLPSCLGCNQSRGANVLRALVKVWRGRPQSKARGHWITEGGHHILIDGDEGGGGGGGGGAAGGGGGGAAGDALKALKGKKPADIVNDPQLAAHFSHHVGEHLQDSGATNVRIERIVPKQMPKDGVPTRTFHFSGTDALGKDFTGKVTVHADGRIDTNVEGGAADQFHAAVQKAGHEVGFGKAEGEKPVDAANPAGKPVEEPAPKGTSTAAPKPVEEPKVEEPAAQAGPDLTKLTASKLGALGPKGATVDLSDQSYVDSYGRGFREGWFKTDNAFVGVRLMSDGTADVVKSWMPEYKGNGALAEDLATKLRAEGATVRVGQGLTNNELGSLVGKKFDYSQWARNVQFGDTIERQWNFPGEFRIMEMWKKDSAGKWQSVEVPKNSMSLADAQAANLAMHRTEWLPVMKGEVSRLNRGGTLSDGPAKEPLRIAIGRWSKYSDQADEMMKVVKGEIPSERWQPLVDALNVAGPDAPVLYRGQTMSPDVFAKIEPGKPLDIPFTSWSSDRRIAEGFTKMQRDNRGGTPVLFKMDRGARGLNIEKLSQYPEEKEWISGGRLHVEKVSTTRFEGMTVRTVYVSQSQILTEAS